MADNFDPVAPLATVLLNCLCAAVSGHPNPPLNCCLRVGIEVAHDVDLFTDLCCEGLAYARMGNVFPSTTFPEIDVQNQANSKCPWPSWAVELQAGIIRCVPTGTTTSMPTCEEWTAAAVQDFADSQSLRQAACCFVAAVRADPVLLGMSAVVGRQEVSTPSGGCIERSFTITVQVPNCDC